jgi:hypothetical protein
MHVEETSVDFKTGKEVKLEGKIPGKWERKSKVIICGYYRITVHVE